MNCNYASFGANKFVLLTKKRGFFFVALYYELWTIIVSNVSRTFSYTPILILFVAYQLRKIYTFTLKESVEQVNEIS